ncbi:MAG: Oligopeptide transport system permease protein OppB, partial [uncultured Thermomicrobiales bacterium]
GALHPGAAARSRLHPVRRLLDHLPPDAVGAGRPLRQRRARAAAKDPGGAGAQVRPGQAALGAVRPLHGERAPRRLRRPVPKPDRNRLRADRPHLAGDDQDRDPDDSGLVRPRQPARIRRRLAPKLLARLRRHLRRHARPGGAELRDRDLADPALFRPLRLAAARRLGRAGALCSAGDRLLARPDRAGGALHPGQYFGRAAGRLRPHRPGEGAGRTPGAAGPRRAQCDDPVRDGAAAGGAEHPHRLDLYRVHLPHPRPRSLLRQQHLQPRLPDDPRAGAAGGRTLGNHVPPDRPALHGARPPDPADRRGAAV